MAQHNSLWEWTLRLLAAAALGIFWWNAYQHWQHNDRQIVPLLFVVSETLTILMLLISYAPRAARLESHLCHQQLVGHFLFFAARPLWR